MQAVARNRTEAKGDRVTYYYLFPETAGDVEVVNGRPATCVRFDVKTGRIQLDLHDENGVRFEQAIIGHRGEGTPTQSVWHFRACRIVARAWDSRAAEALATIAA